MTAEERRALKILQRIVDEMQACPRQQGISVASIIVDMDNLCRQAHEWLAALDGWSHLDKPDRAVHDVPQQQDQP